jgi:hypothetical protein
MSLTVKPSPTGGGGIIFHLVYTGEGKPQDCWVLLLDPKNPDPKQGKRLVGFDQIPPDKNPQTGFDIGPYYPGSPTFPTNGGKLADGIYTFAVTWSFGGAQPDITDPDKPNIIQTGSGPAPDNTPKEWSWLALVIWAAAGGLASAIGGLVMNVWTAALIVPCFVTGLAFGALGSALGRIATFLFDAPKIRWTLKSAFLFGMFFTLIFSMVLGLLSVGLEREAAARGEALNRVTAGVSALSGFLAATLAGVLNNLRDGA